MQGNWDSLEFLLWSKFGPAAWFIPFEQSFFFQQQNTLYKVIFYNIFRLDEDPDPYREKKVDPDPQKMNADSQPWF